MLEVESMFSSQRRMSVIYKYETPVMRNHQHIHWSLWQTATHMPAKRWQTIDSMLAVHGESWKMSLININKDRPRDREIRAIKCHFMLTKGWTDSCVKCTDHICLSWSPILCQTAQTVSSTSISMGINSISYRNHCICLQMCDSNEVN